VHGGGRGADVDRIRQVNAWSTGELMPDLTLVVPGTGTAGAPRHVPGFEDVDLEAMEHALGEAADADPDRCILCPAEVPSTLPEAVRDRLQRLLDARTSGLATAPARTRAVQ
jgi:dTMP kinase